MEKSKHYRYLNECHLFNQFKASSILHSLSATYNADIDPGV